MSNRHRSRNGKSLPEDREVRKAEHRKVRRTVHQELHVATLEGDTDDLVLDTPHPTHGYTDEHEQPAPHADGDPEKRVKHWKQPFWKRRTQQRRQKAQRPDAALTED